MKNIIALVLITLSTFAYSQNMKIKWEDNKGREFGISAPSGKLSYGMIPGDEISYDLKGKIYQVGNVKIIYDLYDRVSWVGNIQIIYDLDNRVSSVGGLSIDYDLISGKITRTSGSVLRK